MRSVRWERERERVSESFCRILRYLARYLAPLLSPPLPLPRLFVCASTSEFSFLSGRWNFTSEGDMKR